MSRKGIGLGVVVAVVGLGLVVTLAARSGAPPASGGSAAAGGSLDDLMMDLQLVPLDGQKPEPFSLPTLDGRRIALADLAGKPALLYFWATW